MTMKIVAVPKVLQELHGETANLINIVLVYVIGIISAVLSLFELFPKNIESWKLILTFILFIDITGGVISNMTFATNEYYHKRPKLKKYFIVAHVIQPLLFSIMYFEYWSYMLFIYLFTMIACFTLFKIKSSDIQRTISSSFLIIGIVVTSYFFKFNLLSIMVIGVLYMLKLILGFSVKKDA